MKIYQIAPGARGTITVHRPGNILCAPIKSHQVFTIHTMHPDTWTCKGTIDGGKYYEFGFSIDDKSLVLAVDSAYVKVIDDC